MIDLREVDVVDETQETFVALGDVRTAMFPLQTVIKTFVQQVRVGEPGTRKTISKCKSIQHVRFNI